MRHNVETSHERFKHRIVVIAVACAMTCACACPILAAANKKTKIEPKEAAAKELRKETQEENPSSPEKEPVPGDKAVSKENESSGGAVTEGVPKKEYRDDDFKPAVEDESTAWMFFKMLLVLALFAGGFYYFYRFVTKKTGVNLFGGEAIRVLSIVPLGQNKFLQIVDLAGRLLVIGVSDGGVSLITEVTDRDEIDRIRILSSRTPPPAKGGGGFHDQIMRQIGRFIERVQGMRRAGRGMSAADHAADMEYLRLQKSRLQKMNGDEDA